MPPALTRNQLLWTGIVLTVIGVAARLHLATLVFALWGDDALTSPALQWAQALFGQVVLQAGLALIAFLLVVAAAERTGSHGSAPADGSVDDGSVPAAASAPRALVRVFWLGVALVVLGLVLQDSFAAWQHQFVGAVDVTGGIVRDILWLVGAPLDAVAVPLGVLLSTGSIVVRALRPAFMRPRVS